MRKVIIRNNNGGVDHMLKVDFCAYDWLHNGFRREQIDTHTHRERVEGGAKKGSSDAGGSLANIN